MEGFTPSPNFKSPAANKSGGSFGGFSLPTPDSIKQYQSDYTANQTQQQTDLNNQFKFGRLVSDVTSGNFGGALGEFQKTKLGQADTGIVNFGKNTFDNMWSVYQQYPSKILDDITQIPGYFSNLGNKATAGNGVANSSKFQTEASNFTNASIKSLLRPAGDTAQALFAPISAAIGSILQASGGQKLQDHVGQTIADSSGITDVPAFQQFALQHPNFSEDFNRLLNVIMSAGETEPIEPKRMVNDIFGLAKKTVEQANPPEGTPSTPEEVTAHQQAENQARAQQQPVQRGTQPNPMNAEPGNYDTPQGNIYTPDSQLPKIDFGNKPKDTSGLPTIDFAPSEPKGSTGSYKYIPLNDVTGEPIAKSGGTPSAPQFDGFTPAPDTSVQPKDYSKTSSGSDTGVSKLASDIANNIQADLGDLPQYKTMNMADQATRALDLIKNDPETAKSIAMGNQSAPGDLREGSIYTALRDKAVQEGDIDTLRDLAHSKLASEATELGQRIKAYDNGRRTTTDPLKDIQDVAKAREDAYGKKSGTKLNDVRTKEVSTADQTIRKQMAVGKQTWSDFIETIKCGY